MRTQEARSTSSRSRVGVLERPTLWALGVFGVTWAISGLLLLIVGRQQQGTAQFASDSPWDYYVFRALPPDPGYFGVASNWDGQWYQRIATLGYLASDADPEGFAQRAWAFPPVYPMTVRLVSEILPIGIPVASWLVSSLFAAAAMVLLFGLTRERLGDLGALGLVAVTGCYITAPLLQVSYAESAALFFLLWTLVDLHHRRYLRALVPLVLLAFTRLITPPLALVALVHLLARRRAGEQLGPRDGALLCIYGVVSLLGPFLWSTTAQLLDGSDGVNRAGNSATAGRLGWFDILWSISPWVVIVPCIMSLWFVRLAWSERRRLGPELATWAAAYPTFVLAATPPTPGFFRYFMFAFPFGVAAVGARDQTRRKRLVSIAVMCAVMLVLQYLWLRYSFIIDPEPGRPILNP